MNRKRNIYKLIILAVIVLLAMAAYMTILDIYHATNLMKIIRKLSDELGKTVVTVLHEINYAAFYSDYICAFKDGRVAKFGTVDEVMTKEVLSEIYNVDFEIMNIQGRPLSIYY